MKTLFLSCLCGLALCQSTWAGTAISVQPATSTLGATNDLLIIDTKTGGAYVTHAISVSNLVRLLTMRFATNLANGGPLTNMTGNIFLHAISGGSASNVLAWGANLQAYAFWEPSHPGGGEFILGAQGSMSLNPGNDAQSRSVLQIGTSLATDDIVMFQYNTPSPTLGSPLGTSKFVAWCNRYWNGGAAAVKDHHMGFRNEAIDDNGNAVLRFYHWIKGVNQNFDDPANVSSGGFGTNLFFDNAALITNFIGLGPVSTSGNTGVAGPGVATPQMQIAWGGYGGTPDLVLGANFNATTRNSGTDSSGSLSFQPRNNGAPIIGLISYSAGGENSMYYGGGTSSGQGVNAHYFFASASAGDAGVGTETMKITSGGVAIGAGTAIQKVMSAAATLDFGSTAAQTSSELTITVTGAAVGDVVSVGLPAAPNANACFTAYVSAADTVKVRFNNYSSGAIDPASGSYRVMVTHF